MDTATLKACYELLGEMLLYPEARDPDRIAARVSIARASGSAIVRPLLDLVADPATLDPERYLETLELVPACPLYLGHYLFDEPDDCRSAASSERNIYMIELNALYRHFGLELNGRELPDFLPVMLEFLALSLERPARDGAALRRRFIDRYLRPALPALRARFDEHGGPWARAVEVLEALLAWESSAAAKDRPDPRPAMAPGGEVQECEV